MSYRCARVRNALLGAGLLATAALAGSPVLAAAPQAGAADMAGGYGWQLLEKVLPLWQAPAGGSGFLVISVRVGSNGEILYCDTRKSSGNQVVDMAACSTVARAGSFAPPSSGMPVEVFLTLPLGGSGQAQSGYAGGQSGMGQTVPGQTVPGQVVPGWTDPGIGPRGNAAQGANPASGAGTPSGTPSGAPYGYADAEQPQTPTQAAPPMQSAPPAFAGGVRDQAGNAPVGGNYADVAMSRIQPHVRVPRDFKGEATVIIRLGVDANGKVTEMAVEEANGSNASVNEAVFHAIRKAGTLPPPGVNKLMLLTFTLRGL